MRPRCQRCGRTEDLIPIIQKKGWKLARWMCPDCVKHLVEAYHLLPPPDEDLRIPLFAYYPGRECTHEWDAVGSVSAGLRTCTKCGYTEVIPGQ